MKSVSNFVSSERQGFSASVRAFLPKYAFVALNQFKDRSNECVVKEGDTVEEGDVLCDADSECSTIHSPLPGKVCSIVRCSLPNGRVGKAVKIQFQGSFSYLGKKLSKESWELLNSEMLCSLFENKGITNTFSRPSSLASEIRKSKIKKNRFVIVRMFDEDPSRMTDSFIAETKTSEVTEGAAIIARAFNAEGIIFALPKKKSISIDEANLKGFSYLTIECDTDRYPVGYTQPLLSTIKKASLVKGAEKFKGVNHKSLFVDPMTALSVYEAVVLGKPVVERYVHVTGDCLRSAAMFRVRIGTTIGSLAEQCGGFSKNPAKIIINGLISGSAISTLDTPVTKYVKSVSFIPFSQVHNQDPSDCIRCGRCRSICPEGLLPDLLFRHQTGGKPVGTDLVFTANLCTTCNLCNSACPSRLPLSQIITLLRTDNNE